MEKQAEQIIKGLKTITKRPIMFLFISDKDDLEVVFPQTDFTAENWGIVLADLISHITSHYFKNDRERAANALFLTLCDELKHPTGVTIAFRQQNTAGA